MDIINKNRLRIIRFARKMLIHAWLRRYACGCHSSCSLNFIYCVLQRCSLCCTVYRSSVASIWSGHGLITFGTSKLNPTVESYEDIYIYIYLVIKSWRCTNSTYRYIRSCCQSALSCVLFIRIYSFLQHTALPLTT